MVDAVVVSRKKGSLLVCLSPSLRRARAGRFRRADVMRQNHQTRALAPAAYLRAMYLTDNVKRRHGSRPRIWILDTWRRSPRRSIGVRTLKRAHNVVTPAVFYVAKLVILRVAPRCKPPRMHPCWRQKRKQRKGKKGNPHMMMDGPSSEHQHHQSAQ